MNVKVKSSDFGNAIMEELRTYEDDVDEAIANAVDEVAKQTVSLLRKTSPKLTGGYQKGWRSRLVASSRGRYVKEVYNKTAYQLTHLLEKGHVKTGGGRVKAIPHLEPAETQANETLAKLIQEALK